MALGEGPNWSRRVPSKKFKICDPTFYECHQILLKGFHAKTSSVWCSQCEGHNWSWRVSSKNSKSVTQLFMSVIKYSFRVSCKNINHLTSKLSQFQEKSSSAILSPIFACNMAKWPGTRVRLWNVAHVQLGGIKVNGIWGLSRKTENYLEAVWCRLTSKTFIKEFNNIMTTFSMLSYDW